MSSPPTVDDVCEEHGITRQGYHAAKIRAQERQACEKKALKIVKQERRAQPKIGTRKLYDLFEETFRRLKIGRDKLFDLLRRHGLLVARKRRSIGTTHWWHTLRRYPNLVKDFTPREPNKLWVSDMTYIPVEDGFAYASIVTDAFSRKIVGFHLASTLETIGPMKALKMALRSADSTEGLIHHSDQGVQYCSKEYVGTLKKHGCRISMTGGGNPYENALAERVNGTLKNEYLLAYGFNSFDEARGALREAVQLYNERRPHLSLSYEKPAEVHERGYLRAA